MAINASGRFRRAEDAEKEDTEKLIDNIKAESWKSWPNEAGVRHPPPFALNKINTLQFVGLGEHRGPISLKVQGYIPSWAAGSLYRTGPGRSTIENTSRGTHYVSHWFDGFAHTHKFDIIPSTDPNGSATVEYSSCRQSKGLVDDIKKRGWRASLSFAQKADPCVGIFAKMTAIFRPIQANPNVVVEINSPGFRSHVSKDTKVGHRTGTDNVFIFTDSSFVEELHPDTLDPIKLDKAQSQHPLLNGPLACAHSQRDPKSGDLFNFNLAFGVRPIYRVFRINAAAGTTDILASIPVTELPPAYIHSMFLTENYVVLCVPTSHIGWNGAKIPWEGNIADAIEPFDKSKLTQWVVIDRRHDKGIVARFTTPAGFFFHSVNAFEEQVKDEGGTIGTNLNFDYVWYENTDIIKAFYYDILVDRQDAARKHWIQNHGYKTCLQYLTRYCFRMPQQQQYNKNSKMPPAEIVLSIPAPHAGELPTINPTRATLPYRYVYTAATRGLSTLIDCLVKTDLETREATVWAAPKGHTPGEAIFVARPDSTGEEDDGVLLSVVLDGTAQRSYLLVLDARNMEEVGRADMEFAIGLGFHGRHATEVK